MPQASDELREEWKSMENALDYLKREGITEYRNGIFVYDETTQGWPQRAWRAIQYLCDEWDFDCGPEEHFHT